MSLLVVVGGIAGGYILGRLIRSAFRAGRGAPDAAPEVDPLAGAEANGAFPCKLGDVVVRRAERDEAWLAGGLVLSEDRPVALLFVAPDAGRDRALFVRHASSELAWLGPAIPAAQPAAREPPSTMEEGGMRFERVRRTPVRVEPIGAGAPAPGRTAILAEYVGPGVERYLLLVGSEAPFAWRGVALAEHEYDVLPGGIDTLEPR